MENKSDYVIKSQWQPIAGSATEYCTTRRSQPIDEYSQERKKKHVVLFIQLLHECKLMEN